MTFEELRADYLARRKRVPSLPITGIIVYAAAAAASLVFDAAYHNLILALCFWSIMPVAGLIQQIRGDRLNPNPANPLFRLGEMARLMVLSTWAIHIPVWIHAPDLLPLTIGIAFALHWVILSWILAHPLGLVHLGLRIVLVTAAWHLVPENRMGAVALAVSLSYGYSCWQMSRARFVAAGPVTPAP